MRAMDAQLPLSTQTVNGNSLGRMVSDTRCSNCRPDLDQHDGKSGFSHSNGQRAADISLGGPCSDTSSSNPAMPTSNSQTDFTSVKIENGKAEYELRTAMPSQEVEPQSTEHRYDNTVPSEEATKHLVAELLGAVLPQYNTLEANQLSAAETLRVLQRDLLQLRVDRMESKVEQDDSFVSVKQSIAGLEKSLMSMKAQVERLMHELGGSELHAEPTRNALPDHACSNAVAPSLQAPYAHPKLVTTRRAEVWNIQETPGRAIYKRKRNHAECNYSSKRRCTAYVCPCPVSECGSSSAIL